MKRSPFLDFINGYESPKIGERSDSATQKKFFSRSISGAVTQRMKRMTDTWIFRVGRAVSDLLSYTSTKAYGFASLSFGILTIILHFMKDYLNIYEQGHTSALIIGVLFAALAIPMLLVDKPISIVFQDVPLADYIFFEFFSIKRMYKSEKAASLPVPAAVVFGVILAIVGFFIPTWWVVSALAGLLFTYLAFMSPEFSFLSSILIMPYLSYIPHAELVLAATAVITSASFIRKVCFGKRVFHFEQYDLLLGLMMLMILISGIFVKGTESFAGSVAMLLMSLGYMFASNLITNRRQVEGALNAAVISSVPYSILCIFRFSALAINVGAKQALSEGRGSAQTVFLMIAAAFAVILARQAGAVSRILYIAAAIANVATLVLYGEYFAVLALLLGPLAALATRLGRLSAPVLLLLFAIPYLVLLLPAGAATQLGVGGLSELWTSAAAAFKDNVLVGIGIGADSFVKEMIKYGVEGATDASNLFIELGLEAGIFALAALVMLLLTRLRHRAVYHRYLRSSQVSALSSVVTVSIFSLICLGAVKYIFADMQSFYMFWCVFGIGSAVLRVARQEHDDRFHYYEDNRSIDYSAIDIDLRSRTSK